MFAPISAIFGLLFFASTLPNGIRLVELPGEGTTVEIVAGYTSGGLTAFTSTTAAKAFLHDSYAAGGYIDFIDELDRTGLRITAPQWALPMLTDHLASLFNDVPSADKRAVPPARDFRERVEEEIRSALLGASVPVVDYATDDAFILISGPAPNALREALAAIPKRASGREPDDAINRLPAERTLRFKSDLPAGAVIFASPIPGVYYRQWYLVLLLDRLIRRIVPLPLKTTMPLTVRPYYYRLELAVPAGKFPEPTEENLLQELQRLQFTPANERDLTAARDEALAYLDSKPIREWFASQDILARRLEGMEWLQSLSADDMRVAARDLLIMNRVIASWYPRPSQTSVSSEPLVPAPSVPPPSVGGAETRSEISQSEASLTPFPPHPHPTLSTPLPERLANGVSLAASSINAVFIAGGTISRFDHEIAPRDLQPFEQYRADRILVLTPASSMDSERQVWSAFKGTANGDGGVPKGNVSSGDLPALFILKTILDLKIIESGWWREATLRIDASEGSTLQIQASEGQRARILDWIKAIANTAPTDMYFAWAREVAIHRFDGIRADLQALTWERDPQGTVQDLETVSPKHVQDVARIYF